MNEDSTNETHEETPATEAVTAAVMDTPAEPEPVQRAVSEGPDAHGWWRGTRHGSGTCGRDHRAPCSSGPAHW